MKNSRGQRSVFTILDELAEMSETGFFRLWIVFDDGDDRVHNRLLVLVTSLFAQHVRQKRHQHRVFTRKLLTQRSEERHSTERRETREEVSLDRIDHHGFELIGDLREERRDLFHQSIDTGFIPRLKELFLHQKREERREKVSLSEEW